MTIKTEIHQWETNWIEWTSKGKEERGMVDLSCIIYSDAPKSGRPDFGVFETCPVVKPSGF